MNHNFSGVAICGALYSPSIASVTGDAIDWNCKLIDEVVLFFCCKLQVLLDLIYFYEEMPYVCTLW